MAELYKQANTVAVHFQMAADELRSSKQLSANDDEAGEDAKETLAEIKFPDDLEHSPDSHSTVAVLVTPAEVSEPFVSSSPLRTQTKGKRMSEVRKTCASSTKENKAPTTTAYKTLSDVSKACDYDTLLHTLTHG